MSDIAELRLVGKEKEHCAILEDILAFARRGQRRSSELSSRAREMLKTGMPCWADLVGYPKLRGNTSRVLRKVVARGL